MEKVALLIVEDDLIVAADLKKILKKAGHSVSGPVDNGRAALVAVKKVMHKVLASTNRMQVVLNEESPIPR